MFNALKSQINELVATKIKVDEMTGVIS